MSFLLRITFWFALVVFLLPLGTSSTRTGEEAVGALEAVSAAKQAIEDVAGICERQPDVCVTGKAALRSFGARARDTARAAYESLDKTLEEDAAPQDPGVPVPAPRPTEPTDAAAP